MSLPVRISEFAVGDVDHVAVGPTRSRLNNDAQPPKQRRIATVRLKNCYGQVKNMHTMKITDEDRERMLTEARRGNDAILGGIVIAVLAVVFGVAALVLMVA
jgi:hypothetical protein